MNTCLRAGAFIALSALLAVLTACGGPAGGGAGKPDRAGVTTIEGQIIVPGDFLADVTLAELMDSTRVWLVEVDGDFTLSTAPAGDGSFELEGVPAEVSGQRLMAIFGSGEDAVTLETLLGPLPASSSDVPSVAVNISLASTVQAEVLRDPELSQQLRGEVLASLSDRDRLRLSSFALEPLDLADGAGMIAIVSDTSSLAAPGAEPAGFGLQADECAWWNPLSWANCWETPDLQVQSGGLTANTIRRPAVPENYVMGLEYQSTSAARIIAAGGGNIIATGGGNLIAAGGGNIIAAGGGNIIATGGGNIIATGGLNGDGLQPLASGVEVVRRVDFGDVLEEGEIGELKRFGPQILSSFVIVPAELFEKYSNEEVAFIAKNISWAGERGREAAERIIADMRAREEASAEIQASFRRAAEAPPVTLPADASQLAAPKLVYVETSAGRAALAAPVIVSARIPADDDGVVEITTRNVESGMVGYWRDAQGDYEAAPLTPVEPDVYRVPLSASGRSDLLIASPGPASPYSNMVSVGLGAGAVTTPGLDVDGFEGIGGQGHGSIEYVVEDASGGLFLIDSQRTVLHLPAGASEWTSLSEGLTPERFWDQRNLLTMGASHDGELYVLLEGQAYRLRSDGRWEAHGPQLFEPGDPTVCRHGTAGVIDRDGGIYHLERCDNTYTLYYLASSNATWERVASEYMAFDRGMYLGGNGSIYFRGRMPTSEATQVLEYSPGSAGFSVSFSSSLHGGRVERLTVDGAGNLLALVDPTGSESGEQFRIYLLDIAAGSTEWAPVAMELPFPEFRPDRIARPRADGPLYSVSELDGSYVDRVLFSLAPGATEWVRIDEPKFEVDMGTFSYTSVEELWSGQNGSLLVLSNDMLFRQEPAGSSWEGLSAGLPATGGSRRFSFDGEEVLLAGDGTPFALERGLSDWAASPLPNDPFQAWTIYDPFGKATYAWGGTAFTLFERVDGGWTEMGEFPENYGVRATAASAGGDLYALLSGDAGPQVHHFDGSSWAPLGEPVSAAVTMTATAEGDVYVAGYEGVMVMAAGSTEWQELGSLYMGGAYAESLVVTVDGSVFGSWRQQGVHRFVPGATSWEKVVDGLPSSNGSAVTVHDLVGDGEGAVYAATDRGVYRLPPGASSWEALPGLKGVTVTALGIGSDNRLYAYAGEQGVFRSIP